MTLPARADVVIVGGGIAGVSTLLALAEQGVLAVLVEKGRLAGEQSSRNWGFCRTQGRDQAEVPLALVGVHCPRSWPSQATHLV
jgi:glycine/D-amino acid oxidase-like deaminating enzyme